MLENFFVQYIKFYIYIYIYVHVTQTLEIWKLLHVYMMLQPWVCVLQIYMLLILNFLMFIYKKCIFCCYIQKNFLSISSNAMGKNKCKNVQNMRRVRLSGFYIFTMLFLYLIYVKYFLKMHLYLSERATSHTLLLKEN